MKVWKALRILFVGSVFLLFSPSFASTIYIYNGPGVSLESLQHTVRAFKKISAGKYQIQTVGPQDLKKPNWEEKVVLFIMPGGADLAYQKALAGSLNQRIRQYVENGGSYLGICAGAYYGSASIDFAPYTELSVRGKRELAFFPGVARGPALCSYQYASNAGAKAALIHSPWRAFASFHAFFNGGCFFENAPKYKDVEVLATYGDLSQELAAIVLCPIGKGIAILSGVHLEYDPQYLDSKDLFLKPIIPQLKSSDAGRRNLLKHLFQRLVQEPPSIVGFSLNMITSTLIQRIFFLNLLSLK